MSCYCNFPASVVAEEHCFVSQRLPVLPVCHSVTRCSAFVYSSGKCWLTNKHSHSPQKYADALSFSVLEGSKMAVRN